MTNFSVFDNAGLGSAGYTRSADSSAITVGMGFFGQGGHSNWVITGVRVWIDAAETGTLTGAWGMLFSSIPVTQTLLAAKAFPGALTAGAWNTISFDTPVSMNVYPGGNYYLAAIYLPNGNYVSKAGVFTSAVTSPTTGDLIGASGADFSGNPNTNGFYRPGTFADPSSPGTVTWTGSPSRNGYGVDVIVSDSASPGPPVNVTPPAISGAVHTDLTGTCSQGTWSNSPTGYAYQWQSTTHGGSSWSNITGATSSTYVYQVTDEGQDVRCRVTATNAAGSTAAASNTVTPTPPITPPGGVLGARSRAQWNIAYTGAWVPTYPVTSTEQALNYYIPEDFGAKGDCVTLPDGAMTNGSKQLTSASGAFTAADEGKAIIVKGAGLSAKANNLVSTIVTVTNGTTVQLNDAAAVSGTFEYSFGTDDTQAFNDAIDTAVEDRGPNGDLSMYATILCSAREYAIAGAPGGTLGFQQIEIPVMPDTGLKFTLHLKGTGDASIWNHWLQTSSQHKGATVLRTFMAGVAADSHYGTPVVLGGPNSTVVGDFTTAGMSSGWSNMHVILDGVLVVAPKDPCMIGVDLNHVAMATVLSYGWQLDMKSSDINANRPTNDQNIALLLPAINNNDNVRVHSVSVMGAYWGMNLVDHLTMLRGGFVYCHNATYVQSTGSGAVHGANILNLSVEACDEVVHANFLPSGARFPLFIHQANVEVMTGATAGMFNDPNNALFGKVWFANNNQSEPTVNGAANLRIVNLHKPAGSGSVTFPATTVASTPVFADRRIYFSVSGGTVSSVAVAGTTLPGVSGAAGQFEVPAGKSFTATYTGAVTAAQTTL